jgi:transposase InsO family protein
MLWHAGKGRNTPAGEEAASPLIVAETDGDVPEAARHLAKGIEPGSPWENEYCESFNGKLRYGLLDVEIFYTLKEAKILIENWRREYNTITPTRWRRSSCESCDFYQKVRQEEYPAFKYSSVLLAMAR